MRCLRRKRSRPVGTRVRCRRRRVHGFGENFGVVGNGNRGLAGVIGWNNRGRAGIIGATMRGGTGVFGASLQALWEIRWPPSAIFRGHRMEGRASEHTASAAKVTACSARPAATPPWSANRLHRSGMWGTSDDGGCGVLGEGGNNPGVIGRSDRSVGVWGEGERGILGTVNTNSRGSFAGHFVGPVYIDGNLTVTGIKGAVVPHPDGSQRLLCAIESPESWFEDFGEATLEKGQAKVSLNADFAMLVNVDAYQVFLSPYTETKGLYVAERTPTGFVVREQQGGSSHGAFGYRIVAKRKDVAQDRLAIVSVPAAPSRDTLAREHRAAEKSADALPKPERLQPSEGQGLCRATQTHGGTYT